MKKALLAVAFLSMSFNILIGQEGNDEKYDNQLKYAVEVTFVSQDMNFDTENDTKPFTIDICEKPAFLISTTPKYQKYKLPRWQLQLLSFKCQPRQRFC